MTRGGSPDQADRTAWHQAPADGAEDVGEHQRVEAREGDGGRVAGLVTDPDMPTRVGSRLASWLTRWLGERTGDEWTVEVVSDPVTAGEADSDRIVRSIEGHLSERDWAYAVCLSDLPMLRSRGPMLAEVSTDHRVALVSLPALGGLAPHRHFRQVLKQVLDHAMAESERDGSRERHQLFGVVARSLSPVRRHYPNSGEVAVRYTTSPVRGWIRLVTGMVRANRPWQLMWGLSSALAAALAAAGFGLFTSTVWQVGDVLGPGRALGAMGLSLGLMTVWLIAAHQLWERIGRRRARDRRLAVLYNTSTVCTLLLGVGCMYAVVYGVALAGAACVLDPSVLASMIQHPAGWPTYFQLAWMVSSMSMLAGAVGSSMESDAAVRQAAYGYREEQRRARHQQGEGAREP